MKTAEIDWRVLCDWEERLDAVYRVFESQRRQGIWAKACDEAIVELDVVRSEIDREVLKSAMETEL